MKMRYVLNYLVVSVHPGSLAEM
uniref:Uncharacterized protein n=1 Tax=Anguilla anguilla TaxID=7936 RepID=A0A0E9XBH6_ANGAN